MEFAFDARGKFVVSLNGRPPQLCATDTDCPFEAICAKDAPWSAIQPAQCVCNIDFSRDGPECHDLSSSGMGMFALLLIALAVAISALTLGCYDIRLLRQAEIKFTMTAVQTSLAFLTIGAFAMIVAILSLIGETFSTLTLVTRGGGEVRKSPSFFTFTNICVASMLFFVQLGMLNICLLWLEVTNVRTRLGERNVRRFRTPALFLTMVYFVIAVVFVGIDRIVYLAYASIPGFGLTLAGYALGYMRMASVAQRKRRPSNTVLRTSQSDNPGFENEVGVFGLLGIESNTKPKSSNRLLKEKRKEENVKRKLRNIANIAVSLNVFGVTGVFLLIVAAGLNGSGDTPIISATGFLHRASFICFAVCLLIVCVYCHQQVCVLVGKKSHFVTSQSTLSVRASSRMLLHKKKSAATLVKSHLDDKHGMEEILKKENPELRERFTEFVRSKFADEPLVFYDACTKYHETAQTSRRALKGKNILLQTLGSQIIENFVKDESIKWVNISDNIRKELLAKAEKNDFDEHTFEKAKAVAFELLKQNFYNQFIAMLEKEQKDEAEDDDADELDVIRVRQDGDLNM